MPPGAALALAAGTGGTARYAVAGGVALLAAVAGFALARRLPDVLDLRPRWLLATFAAPLAYAAVFAWRVLQAPGMEALDVALVAGSVAALFAGAGATGAAAVLETRRHRERATVYCRATARRTPGARRRQRLLGGALAAIGLVAMPVGFLTSVGGNGAPFLGTLVAGGVVAAGADEERTVLVTDRGLFVDGSRRPWHRYASVRETDEGVRVEGTRWQGDETFDAADIEDPAAFAATVEQALGAGGT